MHNKLTHFISKKPNISHQSKLNSDSHHKKKRIGGSAKKEEWDRILIEIQNVTTKVKKLYEGQSGHKKSRSPQITRKSSIGQNSSSKKSKRSYRDAPMVNCFLESAGIQKIPIKSELIGQLQSASGQKNIRNNIITRNSSNNFKIEQKKQNTKKNRSFIEKNDLDLTNQCFLKKISVQKGAKSKSFVQNKHKSSLYGDLISRYQELEKSHTALYEEKQLLLQKLCEESKQKKELEIAIRNLDDVKHCQESIEEQIRNKIPTQRTKFETFFLSDDSSAISKENFIGKTPKKSQQPYANRVPLGSKPLNQQINSIINNSSNQKKQSSHFCSFSEAFTSKCLENQGMKRQINDDENKTQSLLIDLSNRSSASNKGAPLKIGDIFCGRSFESINLEKQLLSLLQKSKFEKDQERKKQLRMQIYEILNKFGVQEC